jgi:GT2 family glycosyltransferase
VKNQPGVSLCIVNYNGAERLARTLACVEAQACQFDEVILIDDASSDGSLQLVERINPAVRVVKQAQNRGPGAARNAGFYRAKNDLVLFIDNDVYLEPDTATALVAHLQQHPDALLVAPRVVYDAKPGVIQYDSADCHFLGLMAPRNADCRVEAAPSNPTETDSVVTSCFLVNRSLWGDEQLFDESFGFNLEDHDFGVRCRLLGHHLWVHPGVLVRHGSGTPGLSYRPGGRSNGPRLFYLTRNRWLIIAKCFSARTLLLQAPAFVIFEIMQLMWLAAHGDIGTWWAAVRSIFRRRDSLRAERRMIQRTRQVPDRDILRDLPLPLTAQARASAASEMLIGVADKMLRGYFKLIRARLSEVN